jgi:hypothetical protein
MGLVPSWPPKLPSMRGGTAERLLPQHTPKRRMLVTVNPYATTVSDRLRNLVVYALGSRYAVEAIDTQERGHATQICREDAAISAWQLRCGSPLSTTTPRSNAAGSRRSSEREFGLVAGFRARSPDFRTPHSKICEVLGVGGSVLATASQSRRLA